jgi:hypothetical protein
MEYLKHNQVLPLMFADRPQHGQCGDQSLSQGYSHYYVDDESVVHFIGVALF